VHKVTSKPAVVRKKRILSHLAGFASGAGLGGNVSRYRHKQSIYRQGHPTRSVNQSSVVTAILGVGDFFGEQCLAGDPLRLSSAIAVTASSIRAIKKEKMLQMLRTKTRTSNSLVAYLLSSVKNYQDHVAHLMKSSAEQRLAKVLLRLAHLDRNGPPVIEIPVVNHQLLAEMVGTTRSRINFFMNRFRRAGFINYDGGLEVHQSLRKVLKRI